MFLFLIVVVSLACGSVAPADVLAIPCLTATAGMILAWGLIAKAAAGFALARVESGVAPLVAVRSLERQLEAMRWLGIGAAVVCLLGFGLAGAVQSWAVFSQAMSLQAIVLLTPGLLLIATTLWAEHQFGVAMGYTAAGFALAVRQTTAAMLRFTGWIIVPILAMLAISDLLALLPWTDELPAGMGLAALTILIVPVLVPWLAKRIWQTRPLDGDQQHWIVDLVVAAGMPRLDVRLWDTGMRSSNAVVIGFFAPLRSLLLTDRLIRDLPPEQLKLIVLHEIAHIRRKHLWLRMLAVIPGWLVAAAMLRTFGTGPLWLLLSNASAIAATLLMLRISAHETEFDADRAACELAMQINGRCLQPEETSLRSAAAPPTAVAAADALAAALRRVTEGHGGADRASWLHPSVDTRCERLQRWAEKAMQQSDARQPLSAHAPFSLPTI
jgi:Zn-dependent protease with chaperone function